MGCIRSSWWGSRRFGGANDLELLLYVTFEGGHKLGKVIANKLGGQTWLGTEVSGFNQLGPSGYAGLKAQ